MSGKKYEDKGKGKLTEPSASDRKSKKHGKKSTKLLICNVCDDDVGGQTSKHFGSKAGLKEHADRIHGNTFKSCPECNQPISSQVQLIGHYQLKHANKKYKIPKLF